jgi:type II secretory pathway pseudopilin PulG
MRSLPSNRNLFFQTCGFTLMEVVIALLVTAITIPLLLSALGASAESGQDMAADTAAAWIARDARRVLLGKWENDFSPITSDQEGPAAPELVLLYTKDGTLLSEGSGDELEYRSDYPKAFFVVGVHVSPYIPEEGDAPELPLATLSIQISYPAKASPPDRQQFHYQTVTTRKGRWK